MRPQLSVVMPVHNAGRFLADAIGSVLDQTFREFEFVILDDASTDGSFDVARRWAGRDDRIRLERSGTNLGLAGSSNAVVDLARSDVIARMDADDVSHPNRLGRQWQTLSDRPDASLVGTLADGIDARGRRVRPRDRWRVVRRSRWSPFPHGSVMFRRAAFESIGGYREVADPEDYDLYLRMATTGALITLPDLLYHYRYHNENATTLRDRPTARPRAAGAETRVSNPHYARGSVRLWAGGSPGVFRDLLDERSGRWTPLRVGMLAWAAWGHLSPASLRWSLRCLATARDGVCSCWVKDGEGYEWRPAR
jgi:glycosyltransferase involved in cell wall biosynthesis